MKFFKMFASQKQVPIPRPSELPVVTPGNFTGSKSITTRDYGSLKGVDWLRTGTKSYESMWDSTHARSILKNIKHFAINSGLRLQSRPSAEILGITAESSMDFARRIEAAWRIWAQSKEASYDGGNSYQQLQGIAFFCMLVWGEFFAIRRWSSASNRINPLTIQLIPPHQVSQPTLDIVARVERAGNTLRNGIELDVTGREVAIYVKQISTRTGTTWTRIPCRSEKTGKQIVLHGFITEEVGQIRGTPFLAPILHDAEKITDMILFELDSAATNASMAGVVTSDKDAQIGAADFSAIGRPGWQGTQLTSTQGAPAIDDPTPTVMPVRELDRGGIVNQALPPGYKYEGIDTRRPNLNIPEFVEKLMTYMSASIGIPIELVQMKFGQNYSASKASIELGWRIFEYFGSEFSADFNQPNYEAWIEAEIASGNAIAPGWSSPRIRAAWSHAAWLGLPIPSLNPAVETRAALERISGGLSNRELESEKLTGTSFTDNANRLTLENQQIQKANDPIGRQSQGYTDKQLELPLDVEDADE